MITAEISPSFYTLLMRAFQRVLTLVRCWREAPTTLTSPAGASYWLPWSKIFQELKHWTSFLMNTQMWQVPLDEYTLTESSCKRTHLQRF